jgi:uncharacterized delta-60 repeat protein
MKKLLLALKLLEGIVILPKIARVVLLLVLVSPLGWLALQKTAAGSQKQTASARQAAEQNNPLAAGDVDTSFYAAVGLNGPVVTLAVQPDGKILTGGTFSTANGTPRSDIARFNPDGTNDLSFNPGAGVAGGSNVVSALARQADGKVLLGGDFTSVNGVGRNGIARLNADGSFDDSFNPGLGTTAQINEIVVQPDGKILVGGAFTAFNGIAHNRLARLNLDGSLDAGFNPNMGSTVNALALQPDGKILVGGQFTTVNGVGLNRIVRLNADGTLDLGNFNPGSGASGTVRGIALQPDGKIIIGGFFTTINGISRNRLARLNSNGSLDTAFNPVAGANAEVLTVGLQSDGRILLGGDFTTFGGTTRNRLARVNGDGTVDSSFNPGAGIANNFLVNKLALQTDGKVVIGGTFTSVNNSAHESLARLNVDGTVDTTFQAGQTSSVGATPVYETKLQTDGKLLVGGDFSSVNGQRRLSVARLNTNGSLDASFAPNFGANNAVYGLDLQTDGKVLIGGDFTSVSGVAHNRISRLNPDGSPDTSFNPGTGANNRVRVITVQPNGKILIGGDFTSVDGDLNARITRLEVDGSFDPVFLNDGFTGGSVYAIAVQPDGKILIGGDFNSIGGITRNNLARLDADGSLDDSFDAGNGPNGLVRRIVLDSSGRLVIGGLFTNVDGTARNRVARLNANGTLDTTFNPSSGANSGVYSLARQTDGKILIGGQFTSVNGTARSRIARLNIDGSLDTAFNPGTGVIGVATTRVYALNLQADGKVLLAGDFTAINTTALGGVGRLFGDATPTPTPTPTPGASTFQFSTANFAANEAAGAATITVNRTGNTSLAGTVEFLTSDGTAQQRSDYTVSSGVLNFASGESSKTFTVLIVDDAYVEGNETINLTLSNPTGGGGLGSPNSATLTIVDNDSGMPNSNPIDEAQFFVRLNYYDFLNRLPDQGGFDFWTGQITQCGADINCINSRRIGVSAAFFVELEFQESGAYVYRLYRAAFGNNQPFPNPDTMPPGGSVLASHIPAYAKFLPDRARVVGGASLEEGKLDFANQFAQRAEFIARYPSSQTPAQFVDAALATVQTASGVTFTAAERQDFINEATNNGRGAMLKRLGDNAALRQAEYNRAFVLTQYFGYLRRDPDMAGLNFWLGVINGQPQNIRGMVCAFLTSTEYQQRFSSVVTRGNNLCSGMP